MAHQELSDTRPTSQHVTVTLAEVPPAAHVGYDSLKRALDVVGSATLLILLAPVLLVTIVLVKMTSPGPVFFRQERAGLRNVPFRITKFRSMYADAEARIPELRERARNGEFRVIDAPAFKAIDDPRVTKIGKYLRKSSLDELPQLFDVLVGNMSLVGPRPLVLAEAELLPPSAQTRQWVRPGITGLWQTEGRSRLSYRERIALDVEYVRRRSMALDIMILLRTPDAVIKGDGAV